MLAEELRQPYVFRDKSLIVAENILLLDGFYDLLWTRLGIIASAIHMATVGLEIEDTLSHLPPRQMVARPSDKCFYSRQTVRPSVTQAAEDGRGSLRLNTSQLESLRLNV